MASVALDEGVGNLQQFIGRLQQTATFLASSASQMDSLARQLEEQEGEAQDTIGGLADDLGEAADALQEALDDARASVEEVAETADEGTTGRLPEGEESLGESASDCEDEAAGDRARLEEAAARLGETGYDGYAAALESAATDVARAGDALGDAFAECEHAAGESHQTLETAGADLVHAFEEATSGTAGSEESLEEALGSATAAWKQSIDTQLAQACDETGGVLTTAYASWTSGASAVADTLDGGVKDAFAQAADLVSEGGRALDEARAAGLDQPSAALLAQLDTTGGALEAAEPLIQGLEQAVPDLQKSLTVVGEVDRLLNAVA